MKQAAPVRSAHAGRGAGRTPRNLVFSGGWGLGDDLMVYWAAVGGTLGRLLPGPLRLRFENPESRSFLSGLATVFPEVAVVDQFRSYEQLCYARSYTPSLPLSALLRGRVDASRTYADPHSHKYLAEFGNPRKPGSRDRLLMHTGLVRAWGAPYDDTYDGWQEVGLACGLAQHRAALLTRRLGEVWPLIRQRLVGCARSWEGEGILFFPSGGSFQDFDDAFATRVKDLLSDALTVRYCRDPATADLRFESLAELRDLVANARGVVTNDSLPSHVAQFFARRHVLICSRSRPGNVCFPGASNTRVVDLGRDLRCRPCAYLPLSRGTCAAGFARCRAQLAIPEDLLESLGDALRWLESAGDKGCDAEALT